MEQIVNIWPVKTLHFNFDRLDDYDRATRDGCEGRGGWCGGKKNGRCIDGFRNKTRSLNYTGPTKENFKIRNI